MTDLNDDNKQMPVVNLVNDAVIADANSVGVTTLELFRV